MGCSHYEQPVKRSAGFITNKRGCPTKKNINKERHDLLQYLRWGQMVQGEPDQGVYVVRQGVQEVHEYFLTRTYYKKMF
jgi:hypothetical protein